jgi:type I restriction-modification system DNA methylase subunit
MATPARIQELAERFEANLEAYKRGGYKETQLRREFIDPFFEELGWDVQNRKGYAEAYKDVIHEDAIKVGGATKAPDYCFRIGGVRKFFLEAKKPSTDIKSGISPAYQLRRYAWSAKLPLSILSDFEELAVYDCRVKPAKTDKASAARTMYLTFKDYADSWDDLAKVFSRDSILKGSFDKYVESAKLKRGTAEVDNAFLKEIERWRDLLARNIALRNPGLKQRQLNFAVQRTIDRIIFLRICEDRGIESYGELMALENGTRVYKRLFELFHKADDRYNSGLFHFRTEKGRPGESLDDLTPDIIIDDKVLKDIFRNLYYPDSPYEFSVLPADILGQVYERFLGSVIRLTPAHRAVVEEKPEVRKAGGVYYTPTYIVDYIVKNTVGKLLEGKKPGPKGAASKLKILDPACGSGSFLLGAYQYLLDWHRDQYTKKNPARLAKGRKPRLYQGPGGEWRLTTDERKRILLNNIYGVDIDPQAVEVTKLSLLLKVLEGENQETIESQLRLFRERALPDLSNNIKCGNSLIGPDFYEGKQMALLDDEEIQRINAFDWNAEFPDIMKSGGFHAVIGNPPYVDIKTLDERDAEYIFSSYTTANSRINLFAVLIERSLSLIAKPRFRLAVIIPTAFLTQESYHALRRRVLKESRVVNLVRLPNESFGGAPGDVKVDTVIVVLSAARGADKDIEVIGYAGYDRITGIDARSATVHRSVAKRVWDEADDCVWLLNTSREDLGILRKCERNSKSLEECADFSLGLTPYDKYKGHTPEQIRNRIFHADRKRDSTFKRLLAGNDVMRYRIRWNGGTWISYGPWLGAPRDQRFFTEKRILVKQIVDWTDKRIWAALTDEELYNTQNAFSIIPKTGWAAEYILGILNSRLMSFYHRKRFLDEFKMRFQKVLIKDCKQFPIRNPRVDRSKGRRIHDDIVCSVREILKLSQSTVRRNIPSSVAMLDRRIEAIDRRIDKLVYELYGLTKGQQLIVAKEVN